MYTEFDALLTNNPQALEEYQHQIDECKRDQWVLAEHAHERLTDQLLQRVNNSVKGRVMALITERRHLMCVANASLRLADCEHTALG